jgi:hypothetical protein
MTTNNNNDSNAPLSAEDNSRPEWVNVDLAACMNVYARALPALLHLKGETIHELWEHVNPRAAAEGYAPHMLEQIQDIAAHLAASTDEVRDTFLSACSL